MKQLIHQEITPGVVADISIDQGKLTIKIEGDSDVLISKVENLIPGTIDNAILDLVKAAIKAL